MRGDVDLFTLERDEKCLFGETSRAPFLHVICLMLCPHSKHISDQLSLNRLRKEWKKGGRQVAVAEEGGRDGGRY